MRQQQSGTFGVDPQTALVVLAEVGGDVEQIGEIFWQNTEVGVSQVDDSRCDAQCLDLFTHRGIRESGDTPDVVVGGQRLGDAECDPPARPGDENLLAAAHQLTPVVT